MYLYMHYTKHVQIHAWCIMYVDEIDDKDVMDTLCDVASKWEYLGLQFGLKSSTLVEIKQNHPHSESKRWLLDVITRRKAQTDSLQWNNIVEALYAIGCHDVANKICKKYKILQRRFPAGKIFC